MQAEAGVRTVATRGAAASFRSPVYWTLLGLIIRRPDYGYGLARRFERDFGEVLPLSSVSHVYEGLKALQRAGLVEEYRAKAGAQPKPHYRATVQGVRAYGAWLKAQICGERQRPSLFALQLAALESEPDLGLEVAEAFERAALQEAKGTKPVEDGGASLGEALTAERVRLAVGADLPWARYAKTHFARLARTKMNGDGAA